MSERIPEAEYDAMPETYEARPINTRKEPGQMRRTPQQMDRLKYLLYEIVEEFQPMTVRQVFYQMVSRGAVEKTEAEYNTTVGRLLVQMRKSGEMPYRWIADNSRWMRKPHSYNSVDQMLRDASASYRRNLWANQYAYVEVWLEKEALAGVLSDVTYEWDVPLMVTRGYPSLSYIYEAADAIADKIKPVYLYYFGDLDPSGEDITRNVEESIRERAPEATIHFEKVAVTREQVDTMGLMTRPTKKTDSRSKNFDGESVEVDAITPPVLREMAENVILRHIDPEALAGIRNVEKIERDTLIRFRADWSKDH